jgi:hypothetical protein
MALLESPKVIGFGDYTIPLNIKKVYGNHTSCHIPYKPSNKNPNIN